MPEDTTVTIGKDNTILERAVHADYTNDRNDKVWLGGESSRDNHFAAPSTTDEEPTTPSAQDVAMAAVYNDEEKISGIALQLKPSKRKKV